MIDLFPFNTLKVHVSAKSFTDVNFPSDLSLIDFQSPFMFLGGGANLLFTRDFPGTIIKVNSSGFRIIKETDTEVIVESASGQNWHDLVMWSAAKNLSGMENMALIPGTVGGAVVGNIAAYGQNQADIVESVEIYDLATQKTLKLSQPECKFFYRESIFKHELKNTCLITKVFYRLSKKAHFSTSYYSRYESLEKILSKSKPPPYSIQDVVNAVIQIRTVKMPDWTVLPSAGSFFKNPFVTRSELQHLQSMIHDLQYYPTEKMLYPHPDDPVFNRHDQVKIPAGRLLDELGWKGKRIGNVGTFANHALVIINYGATGQEIYEFAETMRADIFKNFGVNLEYEVIIV
jgi:UDP-N-acetylmuramate dehydrogenase